MSSLPSPLASFRSIQRSNSANDSISTGLSTPVSGSSYSTASDELNEEDEAMFKDIKEVQHALNLFLDSHIAEAEQMTMPRANSTLYWGLASSCMTCLKAMMTFAPDDIELSLSYLKQGVQLASAARKKDIGFLESMTSWVKGGSSISVLSAMTISQLHAELVWAESHLLKALVAVVHDESFLSLIREGIQVRSSYGVYRSLYKYMEYLKAEKAAGRPARVLDSHFVSGVHFGLGCFNLMLSILPTSLLKLVEFIGFSSDRKFGLSLLESQGGWESFHKDPEQPLPEQTDARSGLRRQFCDMVIITYHTVISTFMPVPDADPIFSERLIQYNLTKYPSGVFFLYFSGRSLAARGLLDEAILQFKKTIEIQREWRQLQHICYWELGLLFLMKGEWESGHECFEILSQESNWSKATYTYFSATALYDQAQEMTNQEDKEKAMKKVEALMKSIPKLTKKIAGKSIPIEKYVARKSRKFTAQNNRLLLPSLEILSLLVGLDILPKDLQQYHLNRIEDALKNIDVTEAQDSDDYCLANWLQACCARRCDQVELAQKSLAAVFEHQNNIALDHFIPYYSHYEAARQAIADSEWVKAKEELNFIIHAHDRGYGIGKGAGAKSKYSMENILLLKCHSCLHEIDIKEEEELVANVEDLDL
ncbi:hypothetical protein K450DRAFT_170515 [Umbelopsis ramanniana AG]|uniref:Tetratricopeptide repeat protein 39B n=1 Tax=Umbelopsis ramanniana AG TaxID=1314678 RepID=A0AAD5EGF9_UMBRA|nr:uncharacterized protein K450DRAFT_170515 [Umbelopsis ramanniana AG]KAI8582769.1 hypothetical protein K450DRAFT_170515 [Umbelopsis ramanniana AG]